MCKFYLFSSGPLFAALGEITIEALSDPDCRPAGRWRSSGERPTPLMMQQLGNFMQKLIEERSTRSESENFARNASLQRSDSDEYSQFILPSLCVITIPSLFFIKSAAGNIYSFPFMKMHFCVFNSGDGERRAPTRSGSRTATSLLGSVCSNLSSLMVAFTA